MKIRKFIDKMAQYLSVDRRECASREACLELVLKRLKERRQALKMALEASPDESEAKRLKEELAIVKAKRKKGLRALKELRKS